VTDGQTDGQTDIPIVASTGHAATLTPCKKALCLFVCLSVCLSVSMFRITHNSYYHMLLFTMHLNFARRPKLLSGTCEYAAAAAATTTTNILLLLLVQTAILTTRMTE